MTDVNDLLRRTLAEGEAWKQAAQDRSESYIEDNDTAFKEAHEYMDSLKQGSALHRGERPQCAHDCLCKQLAVATIQSRVLSRLDSLEERMGVLEAELNEARAVLDQAGTLIDERAAVLEGLLLALATGTAESKDYRFLLQQLAHPRDLKEAE